MSQTLLDELDKSKIPKKLKIILADRKDLLRLGFHKDEQITQLVRWIFKEGQFIYQGLLKGDFKTNEILKWLSEPYESYKRNTIPLIIYIIWEINPHHKTKWDSPKNNYYRLWLMINWHNLKVKLPTYNSFFLNKNLTDYVISNLIFNKFNWQLFKNIKIQINVIQSINYQLFVLRVVRNNFGFLGLFIEPFGTLLIFILIRILISQGNQIANLDNILFLSTGILYVYNFRMIAIVPNISYLSFSSLFNFRQIKPIDLFISCAFFEGVLIVILYLITILFVFFIRGQIIISNIGLLIFAFFLLVIFNFSVSLFLRYFCYLVPFFKNFLTWISRVLFFISGTFFPLSSLPSFIKPYLSWNPILQSIELSRKSLDINYILDPYISLRYLVISVTTFLLFSIVIYGYAESNLIKK